MELCTTIQNTILTSHISISFNNKSPIIKNHHLQFHPNKISNIPGVLVCNTKRRKPLWLRPALDETSSQSFSTTEENKIDEEDDNDVRLDVVAPVNVNPNAENENETESNEEVKVIDGNVESSLGDGDGDDVLLPLKQFFTDLNIQLDVEDTPTILVYGGSALLAVWLLSAIVGAIDSIPVFPKLLEVVGLGYSVWFTTRYLLFKKNREELGSKIEELKQEVFGSSDK